ncbi:MAG: hypothetical protein DCF25_20680 [Leptolyngbya foveolarum]|uniref:Uncharacterized protein n=1 Tax=Leptolyngbya foveolarum TaxID=47253 RepID=A0A2W4VL48_9CYAN|nr:MAG: hypothetical protein DCF25_20680 [Leptolyngbya foveolarum]
MKNSNKVMKNRKKVMTLQTLKVRPTMQRIRSRSHCTISFRGMTLNNRIRTIRSRQRSGLWVQLPVAVIQNAPVVGLSLASIAMGVVGGLPLLFVATAISVTGISLYKGKGTKPILNRLPVLVSSSRNLFLLVGLVIGVSLLTQGQPSYAQLFEGAKGAADSGIGAYIGTDEATSIIDIITFAMWALLAVGAIGTIIGGASQSIQVLVGGLTLFFGMAILIGVLEFTDGLLFGS